MSYPPNAIDALHSLGFTDVSGKVPSDEQEYGDLSIFTDGKIEPSPPEWKEVKEKLDELTTNWTAQEYARNRKNDYPEWSEQLNKIYDDGIDKWKTEMVDPVKAKWPKDNSGPK